VRGCQQESKANDDVLWAYDALNRQHSCRRVRILISALVQELGPLVFRNRLYVRDGLSGDPVAGAMIGGMVMNAKGEAKVKFKTPGSLCSRLRSREPLDQMLSLLQLVLVSRTMSILFLGLLG
jgi:hypothetical protein